MAPYKCPNGSCVIYPEECSRKNCPKYTPFACPDGTCSRFYAECSTSQICPLDQSLFCLTSRKCVENETKCLFAFQSKNNCPSLQNKCWDGSCRQNFRDCPSEVYCPIEEPFYCVFDGQCKISKFDCLPQNQCVNGTFEFPDGSCSENFYRTLKTCTNNFPIKCVDGSCRKSPEDCPFFNCPESNQTVCHSSTFCIFDRKACSGVKLCPAKLPLKCPDDQCVESIEKCNGNFSKMIFTDEKICMNDSNFLKCPGGLCVQSQIECPLYLEGLLIDCLMKDTNFPFPCSDGTCAADVSQCKGLAICEGYKCFEGNCVNSSNFCLNNPFEELCSRSGFLR